MAISGSQIVAEVERFAGDPYVYGATGPGSFDCSGLVQYVLTKLGVTGVPRTSEEQWAWVTRITESQLRPGDLVFAQFPGDNQSPGHVGVYTGGGQVLSAEDPAQGVQYAPLSSWAGSIVGFGRVPSATAGAASSGGGGGSVLSDVIGSLPGFGQITGFFSDADTWLGDVWHAVTWLVNPANWVRIFVGAGAAVMLGAGLFFLIRAVALWPITPMRS